MRLTDAAEANADVLETGDYENGVDDIVLVENDSASRFASVEGIDDVWTIVLAATDGDDGAGFAVNLDVWVGCKSECEEWEEGKETHEREVHAWCRVFYRT